MCSSDLPEQYATKDADKARVSGLFECIIAKHRNGPTGVVALQWLASYMRLESRAKGETFNPDEHEYTYARSEPDSHRDLDF